MSLDDLGGNHYGVIEEGFDESLRRPIHWKEGVVEKWDEDYYVDKKEDSGYVRRCLRTDLVTERNQTLSLRLMFWGLQGFKR